MSYEPKKYINKPVEEKGTQTKGKVINVEEGTLSSFIEPKILKEHFKNATPQDACIRVTFELRNEEKTRMERTLTLPKESNEVHPSSNLGKWKKVFGDYPHKEQDMYVEADGKGYFNIPK